VKNSWKVVTKKQPTPEMEASFAFAWLATKHVKSNAIVLVQGSATVGIGTGQPNRVDSGTMTIFPLELPPEHQLMMISLPNCQLFRRLRGQEKRRRAV